MSGEIDAVYARLIARFGHRGWWPARSALEVIVGAILTQNTAWRNVETAMANLRRARVLSVTGLRRVPRPQLARLVRPSGYFNQKARKLKAFVAYLDARHGGSLAEMRSVETAALRRELLAVHGVGPETADSILLYALGRRVFVVDAYTRRVLERHRLIAPRLGYEEIRAFLESRARGDIELWKDLHAQIVAVGHHYCGPTPRCAGCPLEPLIPANGIRDVAPRRGVRRNRR